MLIRLSALILPWMLFSGCIGDYQYLSVKEIPYGDLFNLTAYVISKEGFALDEINPADGSITTYWNYDKLVDVGRFPIRRKVKCFVDPEAEKEYVIRLEISQEALWESYMTTEPESRKGWEEYGYDREGAHAILSRINLMVKDFEFSSDFYKKWERKSKRKESVPDVLKTPEEK